MRHIPVYVHTGHEAKLFSESQAAGNGCTCLGPKKPFWFGEKVIAKKIYSGVFIWSTGFWIIFLDSIFIRITISRGGVASHNSVFTLGVVRQQLRCRGLPLNCKKKKKILPEVLTFSNANCC